MNKDFVVVIPTLNPNIEIMNCFIEKLQKYFSNIIIVNDGSKSIYDSYFEGLEKKNIIVLKHYINYGKGRALKNAINYIYNNYNDFQVIVTADSDGQHSVKDILKCGKGALKYPNSLILGSRDFSKQNVPFKSRYGNIITRNVFKIFVGIKIKDTQTGLRAMHKDIALNFLDTQGERFEYETKVLIDSKNKDISIKEIEIETIYIDDNSESHFNPIKDSFLIYKLFGVYLFASLSSFALDLLLFALLYNSNKVFALNIIGCTIIARIFSSIYNYFLNRNLVFKKFNNSSFKKYYFLVVCQMFVSAIAVNAGYILFTFLNPLVIKVVVDFIIFIINFIIQREWVFKKK